MGEEMIRRELTQAVHQADLPEGIVCAAIKITVVFCETGFYQAELNSVVMIRATGEASILTPGKGVESL